MLWFDPTEENAGPPREILTEESAALIDAKPRFGSQAEAAQFIAELDTITTTTEPAPTTTVEVVPPPSTSTTTVAPTTTPATTVPATTASATTAAATTVP